MSTSPRFFPGIAVLPLVIALHTAAADEKPQKFSIPAQSLSTALTAFSKQSSFVVIADGNLVEGINAPSIDGVLKPEEALKELLKNSGLTYAETETGTLVIKKISVEPDRTPDTHGSSNKFIFEEIVVTAEKRAESAHDIPIAISAYSGETLSKAGVEGLLDLQKQSPSLQIGSDGHQLFVTMRGVGAEVSNIGAEAGVTVSQDGVAYGRNTLLDADFLDVERIEVLRGPQGTINGRNATGGAVNVYSRRPTEDFEGSVKITAGNYNRFATEGILSGPIFSDRMLSRFAFSTENADGWLQNTLLDEDVEDRNKVHARASFLFDIGEKAETLLILDGIRDWSTRQSIYSDGRILPDLPSFAETSGVREIDRDSLEFEGEQSTSSEKEQFNATLRLTWDITSTAALASTTGYVYYNLDRSYDCDGTRLSVCALPQLDYDVWQITEELTLTADLTERLDLVLGGLVLRENAKEPVEFVSAEFLGLGPRISFGFADQDLESYAAYTQLRYRLTDSLQISFGARYTYDKKNYREVPGMGSISAAIGPEDDSWDAFTPRIAVNYTPTDDLTLFANAARGFKAGGFNTFAVSINPFNPEFVWSYEAGAKVRLFDDRMRLASSAFFMDYTDLQQNVFGLNGGFSPTILNAGQAEIKGLEWEIEIFPTDALRFTCSGTWLDTEFTELRTADNISPELGEPDPTTGLNIRDLAGNRLPRAPEWQLNVGTEYSQSLAAGIVGVLQIDYSWRSDVFFSIYNRDSVTQDAYGLLNFYLALESDDNTWSLSAFARNVTDERYYINRSEQSAGLAPVPQVRSVFGTPRLYGLSLSYHF